VNHTRPHLTTPDRTVVPSHDRPALDLRASCVTVAGTACSTVALQERFAAGSARPEWRAAGRPPMHDPSRLCLAVAGHGARQTLSGKDVRQLRTPVGVGGAVPERD
jgi:hypothetical protein